MPMMVILVVGSFLGGVRVAVGLLGGGVEEGAWVGIGVAVAVGIGVLVELGTFVGVGVEVGSAELP